MWEPAAPCPFDSLATEFQRRRQRQYVGPEMRSAGIDTWSALPIDCEVVMWELTQAGVFGVPDPVPDTSVGATTRCNKRQQCGGGCDHLEAVTSFEQ